MSLYGVVLAAGEGRRMGLPKARLITAGRTLLEHHACRFYEVGCVETALVVRPPFAVTAGTLVPVMTESPAHSLAEGLRFLVDRAGAGPGDRVFVTPVDLLPPAPAVYRALLGALDAGALAATPTYEGRGGHPVAASFEALSPYLEGEALPLRELLGRLGSARARVVVDDARVLGDFDTPAELAALY